MALEPTLLPVLKKGVDIDGTVKVLLRAAKMIQEIAGGKCSEVVDVYPHPVKKNRRYI